MNPVANPSRNRLISIEIPNVFWTVITTVEYVATHQVLRGLTKSLLAC